MESDHEQSNSDIFGEAMINFSGNGTIPSDLVRLSTFSLIQIILAAVVFLFGLFGNYFVLISVKKVYEQKYSSMHHMLAYVCYTEFLFLLIVIPIDIAWRSSIGWYAGELECKVTNFSRCFVWFLSSLVLIFMSVDCSLNVFKPQRFYNARSKRRVHTFMVAAVLLAVISATPKYYLSHVSPLPMYPEFRQCLLGEAPIFFSVYPILESYFAPLVVVTLCYIPSFFKICHQLELLSSQHKSLQTASQQENYIIFDRNLAEGVKLTFAISFIIIICYTPQIILIIWHFACASFQPNPTQEFIVYLTEMLKSLAIPCTYWIFRSKPLQKKAIVASSSIVEI